MSARVTVVTANIGRNVKPAETRDNIERVRHGFEPRIGPPPGSDLRYLPVVGWQEIDEADQADEHNILEQTFGEARYHNIAFRQAVPISVPVDWVPLDADVTLACNFLPKATPNRYIVSALCSHPDLPEPVVFMNGHYPLARLGGKQGASRWKDCQKAWVEKTIEWHRAGHTVITTRDTNRLRMPKLHPSERLLTSPAAIARITVVEGSVAVRRVGPQRVVNLTIDNHDAKGVDLVLSVKR